LKNIVGNLIIAEHQVDKLRTRLANLVDGYRFQMKSHKVSMHVFRHNNNGIIYHLK